MAPLTHTIETKTPLERELKWLLADVIDQALSADDDEILDTGCIRIYKDALMMLVQLGVMEECYPEKNYSESWTRWYYAKFKKDVGRNGQVLRTSYRLEEQRKTNE